MPENRECRLCGTAGPLCESHIFPKFYWDWLKSTNGTGYLRSADRPNQRQQDGYKRKLLCSECETRFSRLETPTAAYVWRPLLEESHPAQISYGPWLFRFALSVLWRNIAVNLDDGTPTIDPWFEGVEYAWRLYLLDQAPLTEFADIHLFVLGIPQNATSAQSLYFSRAEDYSVATQNDRPRGVFAKFGHLMIWANLRGESEALWVNTKIDQVQGTMSPGSNQISDPHFGGFLMDRVEMIGAAHDRTFAAMTPNQRQRIRNEHAKHWDRIRESHFWRAMTSSTGLTSAESTARLPVKTGRNELCPCGSQTKFKKCCGR